MITLLVPCAGKGIRLNKKTPKQFLVLKDKPIFIHTLLIFEKSPFIDYIVLATRKEYINFVQKEIERFKIKKVTSIVEGGETRQASVYNAMLNAPSSTEIFLVHDAVRPFVSLALIEKIIEYTKQFGSAIPALKVRDTVIKAKNEKVYKKLEREDIFLVQTPQGIKADILRKCLTDAQKNNLSFSDESTLLLHYKYQVHIVEGEFLNFKITYPEDLRLAEYLVECKIKNFRECK